MEKNKTPIAALIVEHALSKAAPKEDEVEEGNEDLEIVAEDLLGAIQAKDPVALAEVLKNFISMC